MIEVDVRGFSCPIPVVKTRKAMEDNPNKPITVIVDSSVSKENVTRLAQGKGYTIIVEQIPGGHKLEMNPPSR